MRRFTPSAHEAITAVTPNITLLTLGQDLDGHLWEMAFNPGFASLA